MLMVQFLKRKNFIGNPLMNLSKNLTWIGFGMRQFIENIKTHLWEESQHLQD